MLGRGRTLPHRGSRQNRLRAPLCVMANCALIATWALAARPALGGAVEVQPKMGDPLPGLTEDELQRFLFGQQKFNTPLLEEEGLGPIFNKESCGNCHANPLGGTGSQTVTRFGELTKGNFDPLEEFGGSLLQAAAISKDCMEELPPEHNHTALRVTNGMMGYGLVEAIVNEDILAVRDAQSPGVQGMANMVEAFEDPGVPRVGRFGWKAQVPTLETFSADASLNEMGLTNRHIQEENDPNGIRPPDLADCDAVPDPEDSIALGNGIDKEFIDVVTDFHRFLSAPPQTPKSGMTGEALFNQIGCNECHHTSFTTPDDQNLEEAIRNKTVKPYSDFLLHDMGESADFIEQGAAGLQ